MLTAIRLRQVLSYDPVTGLFTHLPRPGVDQPTKTWNTRYAGKIAGTIDIAGRRRLRIDGTGYLAARCAWLYMTGKWPSPEVDHENTDGCDDRWSNLREATRQQNACNTRTRRHSRSGLKGVRWHEKTQKWQARITGKSLGYYDTKEQAHRSYCAAARHRFGDFFRAA